MQQYETFKKEIGIHYYQHYASMVVLNVACFVALFGEWKLIQILGMQKQCGYITLLCCVLGFVQWCFRNTFWLPYRLRGDIMVIVLFFVVLPQLVYSKLRSFVSLNVPFTADQTKPTSHSKSFVNIFYRY